jgi:putative transposase
LAVIIEPFDLGRRLYEWGIRTNDPLERILQEVRRRTRGVGAFLEVNSALMLVAARLRHVTGTRWRTRSYFNMQLLTAMEREAERAA